MGYRKTKLGALITLDPVKARATIRKALEQSGGNVGEAAETLQVSRQSLYRMIDDVGLRLVTRVEEK